MLFANVPIDALSKSGWPRAACRAASVAASASAGRCTRARNRRREERDRVASNTGIAVLTFERGVEIPIRRQRIRCDREDDALQVRWPVDRCADRGKTIWIDSPGGGVQVARRGSAAGSASAGGVAVVVAAAAGGDQPRPGQGRRRAGRRYFLMLARGYAARLDFSASEVDQAEAEVGAQLERRVRVDGRTLDRGVIERARPRAARPRHSRSSIGASTAAAERVVEVDGQVAARKGEGRGVGADQPDVAARQLAAVGGAGSPSRPRAARARSRRRRSGGTDARAACSTTRPSPGADVDERRAFGRQRRPRRAAGRCRRPASARSAWRTPGSARSPRDRARRGRSALRSSPRARRRSAGPHVRLSGRASLARSN